MLKNCIFGGILGGIILFVWGALSWMILPWHMMTLKKFSDETVVQQVLQANAPESGIYMAPLQEANQTGPQIFSSIYLNGMGSMTEGMLISLLTQFIAAFLVTWMLTKTNLSYAGRLGFVLIFAFTAGIITHLPYWIWFKFSSAYTLVAIADILVGWFLAGLFLAKISEKSYKS